MHRLVSTSDVDEARLAIRRIYADATLEPIPGAPFGCTMDTAACDGVNMVRASWLGGVRAVAPVISERYIVAVSSEGSGKAEQAGERVVIAPGRRGALLSPGRGAVVTVRAGHQGRSFSIERDALEAQFRALTGGDPRAPIVFRAALDLEAGPGATVLEIAQALRRELERPEASPILVASLREALLTSLLTNAPHSASSLLDPLPRRVAPGCVRKAEEYIDAHAVEPITIADIAAAAGVSMRSLQVAFKTHRDTTPMERLRTRRVELARQRLLDAEPGTAVARVVTTLGLGDAGRFSVRYKKRFGESPSETLARGRTLR
ncbi:MAG: AraC family transcriptional regulator [Minicystis sp.]